MYLRGLIFSHIVLQLLRPLMVLYGLVGRFCIEIRAKCILGVDI